MYVSVGGCRLVGHGGGDWGKGVWVGGLVGQIFFSGVEFVSVSGLTGNDENHEIRTQLLPFWPTREGT